jgi:hypothetical protein
MSNSNAPYGFRLWAVRAGGSGAVPMSPIRPKVPSAGSMTIGDPLKISAGLGYIASGTNAVFGVLQSKVPGWNETATEYHYPDVLPADPNLIWCC